MKTAAVLLFVLSLATSSASAAAVIDPSASTRRIQTPDSDLKSNSDSNHHPRALPLQTVGNNSTTNSTTTYTFSSASSSDASPSTNPGNPHIANTAMTSRRRPRPWGWARRALVVPDTSAIDIDNAAAAPVTGQPTDANDDTTTSTPSDDDVSARRRMGGWPYFFKRSPDHDSDSTSSTSSSEDPSSTETSSTPRYTATIATWAGVVTASCAAAVIAAVGIWAAVVRRRRVGVERRNSRDAAYAAERKVWEEEDEDDEDGEWGLPARGGSAASGVADLEKGGLVVKVEDYRGVKN